MSTLSPLDARVTRVHVKHADTHGCIPIAAKHQKLDDQQRKEWAQFYTDAALKLLRDAASKGYKNVAHLKKDTDLDPLPQRDDCQKLVAELEGKGK
jgi:hypothetical protein